MRAPSSRTRTKSATWNRGAYLVEALAHCNDCHTPRNLMGATIPSERFEGAQIDTWYAPNITEKALKEVNKWDKARLVDFLKKGAAANSTTLGPMHVVVHDSLSKLKESDIAAIATYMLNDDTGEGETVEPAKVAKLTPKMETHAEKLYDTHCAVCHQKTGEGMKGKVPPLAGNPAVEATDPYNIFSVVLQGDPGARRLSSPCRRSPTELSNQDIADIANYVRITWGNKSEPDTTPDDGRFLALAGEAPDAASRRRSRPRKPASRRCLRVEAGGKRRTRRKTRPLRRRPPHRRRDPAAQEQALLHRDQRHHRPGGAQPERLRRDARHAVRARHRQLDRGRRSTRSSTAAAFLGLGEYKVVVPFELVQFTGQWDNPMLAMSAFKLENAPRISDTAVEDLLQSPDWRRSVAAYFGVALSRAEAGWRGRRQDGGGEEPNGRRLEEGGRTQGKRRRRGGSKRQADRRHAMQRLSPLQQGRRHVGGTGPLRRLRHQDRQRSRLQLLAALKKHTGDWDAANLNDWLKSPSTFAPGTYMTFPGIAVANRPRRRDRLSEIAEVAPRRSGDVRQLLESADVGDPADRSWSGAPCRAARARAAPAPERRSSYRDARQRGRRRFRR